MEDKKIIEDTQDSTQPDKKDDNVELDYKAMLKAAELEKQKLVDKMAYEKVLQDIKNLSNPKQTTKPVEADSGKKPTSETNGQVDVKAIINAIMSDKKDN